MITINLDKKLNLVEGTAKDLISWSESEQTFSMHDLTGN